MKNILKNRYVLFIIITSVCGLFVLVGIFNIKLDASIRSLFPFDENLDKNMKLQELSPISDKIIVFIEVKKPDDLPNRIKEIEEIINSPIQKKTKKIKLPFLKEKIEKPQKIDFINTIPSSNDIQKLISYSQSNSLILYPYENSGNPFKKDQIKKRLINKEEYLYSLPFMDPDESFFLDPLMMGFEVIQNADKSNKGKFSPQYGGLISKDKKTYIKILKSGIKREEYKKIKILKQLDEKISEYSKENNFNAFLFGIHLFYNESLTTTKRDVTVIFIITSILVILIFLFFFRDIPLSLFSFMPITVGFAVTFLLIAIFRGKFGGIALAFGGTTSGIAIDYSIHYLTKRHYYSSLKDIRKKIGFSLLLGFLTTIASFIFLPFSRIFSLVEISIFGITAISISFIVSWFILQRMMPPKKEPAKLRIINFKSFGLPGFIFIIIIICISAVFIPFVRFEDNIKNLDMAHTKLNKRAEIIKNIFEESSAHIYLAFEGKDKEELLNKAGNAYNLIKKKNPDLIFFSPHILTPSKKQIESRKKYIIKQFDKNIFLEELKKSNFSQSTFDIWINKINDDNYQISNIPAFFKDQIDSMFVTMDNNLYLLISIHDQETSTRIKGILNKNMSDFFIINMVEDCKNGLLTFEKSALFFLLLSIIIIYIILLVSYRNFLYAFTSIFPSLVALLGCLAVTVITGHRYNMMHFVSSVLLLGIGVDYGIFITGAFKQKYDNNEMNLTLQSILISALTTLAGFGVLLLSKNYSIFSLGSSMFAGIVFAFLTAYLAVPFLLGKRKISRGE